MTYHRSDNDENHCYQVHGISSDMTQREVRLLRRDNLPTAHQENNDRPGIGAIEKNRAAGDVCVECHARAQVQQTEEDVEESHGHDCVDRNVEATVDSRESFDSRDVSAHDRSCM